MATNTLACRLIKASHLAYDINDERIADQALADESYESVGVLQFIDWSDPEKFLPESGALSVARKLHLLRLILNHDFQTIAGDHSSAGGYGNAQYPEALVTNI